MIIPIPYERLVRTAPPMMPIDGIILRLQPFSAQIMAMCEKNQDFQKAIKSLNSARFISFGTVIISYPKNEPEDMVIGILVYDYKSKIYKQDFMVDIGSKHEQYILYTSFHGMKSKKYLKPIGDFFKKYPCYSRECHHPKFEDIPLDIQPRALHAIELAKIVESLENPHLIPFRMYVEFSWSLIKSGL